MSAYDPKRTCNAPDFRCHMSPKSISTYAGTRRIIRPVLPWFIVSRERPMDSRRNNSRFRFLLVATAAVTGLEITAAAEREMPKFDITAACRGSGSVQTPAKCMQDEQAARDQLEKLWPQFKQADASRCIQITTSRAAAANYTELLSCLQAATAPQRTDPFGGLPKIAK